MSDARNIALTVEATAAADRLVERLRLDSRLAAVRLGVSYAMRHHLSLERDGWGPPGSNYNVGSVDTPDRAIQRLVGIFYDDPDVTRAPYHAIETLMSKGLLLLWKHVAEGVVVGLGDLCEPSSVMAAGNAAST